MSILSDFPTDIRISTGNRKDSRTRRAPFPVNLKPVLLPSKRHGGDAHPLPVTEFKDSGPFAKKCLIKHHGISRRKFFNYLKEIAWGYNRGKDLFDDPVDLMLH